MKFLQSLLEKDDKKEEKKKVVFVETDPRQPFPENTVSALQKFINKEAKDLEKEWLSAIELVDYAFSELDVPKPLAYLTDRWQQYNKLISVAVTSLKDARGMKSKWTNT